MLEGACSYQRGQENLVPSNNASSVPESPVIPKAQEKPWYIQHFTKLLIGFGLGGGAVALVLPWMLWLLCGMSSGSSDQLRLHLLYVTGGIIAVLTLLQTNWKNQGDRLKIDADIKKNEQDAENEAAKREQDAVKSERDHIRQVHVERRSRYTKAVEQLANEKAAVRLGGIYTLVGLVDEWLADDTLNPEEQQKEGQVIINNLCSYIRSPFTLALKAEMFEGDSEPDNYEGDFSKDQAAFHEEQDVRRTIFVEMSKRSSAFTRDGFGKIIDTSTGTWSDFEFDFSRASIFYPLSNLTIEKGKFSDAKFYAGASFENSKWDNLATFDAIFYNDISFKNAIFSGETHFTGSKFKKSASFYNANFRGDLYAKSLQICGPSDFSAALFESNAYFNNSEFHTDMKDRKEDIDWSKTDITKFWGAIFKNKDTGETADFCDTHFYGYTDFKGSTFKVDALFRESKFMHGSNFYRVEFTLADFKGAHFNRGTKFQNSTFIRQAYFVYSKGLLGYETFLGAKFSYSGNYDFDLIPLGHIRKDVNFDDDCMLYPIGSRVYIDKNGTRIYSSPAHA